MLIMRVPMATIAIHSQWPYRLKGHTVLNGPSLKHGNAWTLMSSRFTSHPTHLERRWRSSSNSLNMMTCLLFRSLTKFKVCLLTFLSAHRCSQTRVASCPSSCANLCAHSQIFTSAIQRHSMCEDLAMAMLLVHTVLAISVSRYDKPIAAIWWRRWQLCVRERLRNRFWLLVGNNES